MTNPLMNSPSTRMIRRAHCFDDATGSMYSMTRGTSAHKRLHSQGRAKRWIHSTCLPVYHRNPNDCVRGHRRLRGTEMHERTGPLSMRIPLPCGGEHAASATSSSHYLPMIGKDSHREYDPIPDPDLPRTCLRCSRSSRSSAKDYESGLPTVHRLPQAPDRQAHRADVRVARPIPLRHQCRTSTNATSPSSACRGDGRSRR